jgi:hypothetical protein
VPNDRMPALPAKRARKGPSFTLAPLSVLAADGPKTPVVIGEAVKKRDWLRAETTKAMEHQQSRRCLFQFFRSLGTSRNDSVTTAPPFGKMDNSRNNKPPAVPRDAAVARVCVGMIR